MDQTRVPEFVDFVQRFKRTARRLRSQGFKGLLYLAAAGGEWPIMTLGYDQYEMMGTPVVMNDNSVDNIH